MQELTCAMFRERLGGHFQLSADGGEAIEVELIEVCELPGKASRRDERFRSEPFSLVFRAHDASGIEQRIYQLAHDQLGTIEMFLVPIGPDKSGTGVCLEAVFN